MRFTRNGASPAAETEHFDLLRTRLEVDIPRPAVIAITSATNQDGKETAARALARSLASTGYTTLLVDSSLAGGIIAKSPNGLTLEELGRRLISDRTVDGIVLLSLSDAPLQKTTSQRSVQSGLEVFRSKFDYTVINTDVGASSSFATAIVAAADAVIATVKTGRRQGKADANLSAALRRIGSRFTGVVALDSSTIEDDRVAVASPRSLHELGSQVPEVAAARSDRR